MGAPPKEEKPKVVEWRETGKEGVHDLYVDRRLVEYDVPLDRRDDAIRRARIGRTWRS